MYGTCCSSLTRRNPPPGDVRRSPWTGSRSPPRRGARGWREAPRNPEPAPLNHPRGRSRYPFEEGQGEDQLDAETDRNGDRSPVACGEPDEEHDPGGYKDVADPGTGEPNVRCSEPPEIGEEERRQEESWDVQDELKEKRDNAPADQAPGGDRQTPEDEQSGGERIPTKKRADHQEHAVGEVGIVEVLHPPSFRPEALKLDPTIRCPSLLDSAPTSIALPVASHLATLDW